MIIELQYGTPYSPSNPFFNLNLNSDTLLCNSLSQAPCPPLTTPYGLFTINYVLIFFNFLNVRPPLSSFFRHHQSFFPHFNLMSAQHPQHTFNVVACAVPNRSLLFSIIFAQTPFDVYLLRWDHRPYSVTWASTRIRGSQVSRFQVPDQTSPKPNPRNMIWFWLYSNF